MLGLGCSGRPPFDLKNSQDCIDYYLYSIEAWMKTVNYKSEEYILMGHSLGGYLSIMFSLRYPANIKKLILFSPVGVPP
jgi:cardiolipin-specific phospholipase